MKTWSGIHHKNSNRDGDYCVRCGRKIKDGEEAVSLELNSATGEYGEQSPRHAPVDNFSNWGKDSQGWFLFGKGCAKRTMDEQRERQLRPAEPTAYYTAHPGGRTVEIASKHREWTDYARRALDVHDRLIAALELATATVELGTGNGARSHPWTGFLLPNGDPDVEAIAAECRSALKAAKEAS